MLQDPLYGEDGCFGIEGNVGGRRVPPSRVDPSHWAVESWPGSATSRQEAFTSPKLMSSSVPWGYGSTVWWGLGAKSDLPGSQRDFLSSWGG